MLRKQGKNLLIEEREYLERKLALWENFKKISHLSNQSRCPLPLFAYLPPLPPLNRSHHPTHKSTTSRNISSWTTHRSEDVQGKDATATAITTQHSHYEETTVLCTKHVFFCKIFWSKLNAPDSRELQLPMTSTSYSSPSPPFPHLTSQ